MLERKIELPRLMQAAAIASVDAEARTVEVVFTTGAKIRHWMQTPDGVRRVWTRAEVSNQAAMLEALNGGAPVLDNHDTWSNRSTIGVVEQAWIEDGVGKARLRFSEAEDVAPVWQRVSEGVLRACSMGFQIHEAVVEMEGEEEVWRLTRWEPLEISMVAIGADPGAKAQSADEGRGAITTEATITYQEQEADMAEQMTDGGQGAAVDDKAAQGAAAAAAQAASGAALAPDPEKIARQAREDERARQAAIRETATALSVPDERLSQALDGDETADAFRAAAVKDFAERGAKQTAGVGGATAAVTGDARDRFRDGAVLGLLQRAGVKGGERNEFTGMTLVELARQSLTLSDPSRKFSDRRELVGQAFVVQGAGHSTSDFAEILANVLGKAALQGWEEAEETFELWTRPGTLTDFKPSKRVGTGVIAALDAVPEGAEYKYGTIGDRAETITLATYGKLLKITRQAIINDDLSMLSSLPIKMGRAAKRTIGDLVYAVLTSNPAMADGAALFHANHNNLAAAGAAPSVATLGAARAAMRVQKDGAATLNIPPKYLLVPAALETSASQLLTSTVDPGSNKGHAANPVAGMAELIADGRLDAASTTAWFLAADPNMFDTIEVAYLDGNDTPFIEEKEGWSVDGVELKVRIDAGVAPLDFRTLYKNAGA